MMPNTSCPGEEGGKPRRPVPVGETKAEKFERLANLRTNQILDIPSGPHQRAALPGRVTLNKLQSQTKHTRGTGIFELIYKFRKFGFTGRL